MKKKTPDFTLYWVQDGIQEDWFVIVPCNYYDCVTGAYMAEWFHCEYEGLTELSSVQDSILCYEAMSDDIMEVPFDKIPASMKKDMRKNYKELNSNIKGLKELFFDPEFECISIFKKEIREMFKNKFDDDFNKIMEWCYENLNPDKDTYNDPEFDGEFFIEDVDQDNAFSLYKIMLDWNTITSIIEDGHGYAPVHGQLDLLKNLGFTIIDDGKKTGQRVVVYDGHMYAEGNMESEIMEARRIMNIVYGQKPDLN